MLIEARQGNVSLYFLNKSGHVKLLLINSQLQCGRSSDQLPLLSQVMTPPGPYPLLHLTVIVVSTMCRPSSDLSVEYCTAPFVTLLPTLSQYTTEKHE